MERAGRGQVAVSAPGTGRQVFILARIATGEGRGSCCEYPGRRYGFLCIICECPKARYGFPFVYCVRVVSAPGTSMVVFVSAVNIQGVSKVLILVGKTFFYPFCGLLIE